VIVVPVLIHEDTPKAVPGSAVGIGFVSGVGAVLLDVLHGGDAAVVISLIAAGTVIVVAGLAAFSLLIRATAQGMAAATAATDQLHGSPFFLELPQNWDQRSLRATVRNDGGSGASGVLAFRPLLSGGTEALLEKPDGPVWYNLDALASLVIEISQKDDQRKQLTGQ
jgi:hypothetical protein